MAGFQIKGIKWVRTPSFQESSETWRARRQSARENFEATTSAALSAFRSISADLATGMSSIAASSAVKRLQDAAKAKAAETSNSVDLLA
jgi:coproporphyrinogen III oxidase-like Fe-S oxidoreductase